MVCCDKKAVVDRIGSRPPNSDHDLFLCKFGSGECFETSMSSYWAGCHQLSCKIYFLSLITIWSRNDSLLHRMREDDSRQWFFFLYLFSSRGTHLLSFFTFPIFFKCQMTLEWLTLSSLATCLIVVRGSASMIALRWLLSTSNGWPLGFSTFIFVFFAKLLQPLLPYTLVGSSWAKCVVYAASCLCCFMTIWTQIKKSLEFAFYITLFL